ncbi:MAG: hypothetical protein RJA10_3461 [Pseudomonadota bacterium]|jgi:hypothetical protein
MQALLGLLALLAAPTPAWSAVAPVDDTGTVVETVAATLRWREDNPARGSAADAGAVVRLVLNTQPWLGRRVRIHMALAALPVRLGVSWTSQGKVLAGRLEPGQRVLLYEGLITTPLLTDRLQLSVTADGRDLTAPLQLQFSQDIEVLP